MPKQRWITETLTQCKHAMQVGSTPPLKTDWICFAPKDVIWDLFSRSIGSTCHLSPSPQFANAFLGTQFLTNHTKTLSRFRKKCRLESIRFEYFSSLTNHARHLLLCVFVDYSTKISGNVLFQQELCYLHCVYSSGRKHTLRKQRVSRTELVHGKLNILH